MCNARAHFVVASVKVDVFHSLSLSDQIEQAAQHLSAKRMVG